MGGGVGSLVDNKTMERTETGYACMYVMNISNYEHISLKEVDINKYLLNKARKINTYILTVIRNL